MKIPQQVDVFLSKAVECYLAESARHKLRVDQSDCLQAFVDLNMAIHEKTGEKLRQVFAQQSFVPLIDQLKHGL